jgi:hypothetical protein
VATEQDAARDRVLAARAGFTEQVEVLEASVREAVDIPAKVRRSPGKAAAVVGVLALLILRVPQRLFGIARRTVRGKAAPLPTRMLPDEVEKTLRKLGDDGDKVGAVLERDFAQYVKKASKDRAALRSVLLLAVARPLLGRAARAAGDAIFSPDPASFSARMAKIRERAGQGAAGAGEGDELADASAKERISAVRQDEATKDAGAGTSGPADETAPTGI